jgi:hypothetical protein
VNINVHRLDARGLARFSSELGWSNHLGRLVLSSVDLNTGTAFAILPEVHVAERVYEFDLPVFPWDDSSRRAVPGGFVVAVRSTEASPRLFHCRSEERSERVGVANGRSRCRKREARHMTQIDWRGFAEWLAAEVPVAMSADLRTAATRRAARCMLAAILGDAVLTDALQHVLSMRPGAELATSVLKLLRPRVATTCCLQLWERETSAEQRCYLLMVLANIADESIGAEVPRLLEDPDACAQACAMHVLRSGLWDGVIDESTAGALADALVRHGNPEVRREAAALLREFPEPAHRSSPVGLRSPPPANAARSEGAPVDWSAMAVALGAVVEGAEVGSGRTARRAIERLIGSGEIERAREIVANHALGWQAASLALTALEEQ